MAKVLKLNPIGRISCKHGETKLVLDQAYALALTGLEGFSHILVLWWFSESDNADDRSRLTEQSPYKRSPEVLGTFATRSPMRPNPIALDTVQITYIDQANAVIGLTYLDAFDGSPVLDIKPYTPSIDRVESPTVPDWCSHWPKCYEDSGAFNWENEFNF